MSKLYKDLHAARITMRTMEQRGITNTATVEEQEEIETAYMKATKNWLDLEKKWRAVK